MRYARVLFLILGTVLPLLPLAARGPYTAQEAPDDFATLQRQTQQEIPAYLDAAQCGGWDLSQSVEGKIASVSGVPGHSGDWDGAMLSGMAVRFDAYSFPAEDTTTGFVTACDPMQASVWKPVWNEMQHRFEWMEFGNPYMEDPICRWRLTAGMPPPDPPPYVAGDFAEMRALVGDPPQPGERVPLSPAMCAGTCEYLNQWQYQGCFAFAPVFDADGNMLIDENGGIIFTCTDPVMRYLCTDVPVRDGGSCVPGDRNGSPNARACIGEECRCPGPGCTKTAPNPDDATPVAERAYQSYFRQYTASYTRAAVPQAANDRAAQTDIPVACYGFYEEFDPQDRRTDAHDRRCVINLDVAERRETQRGKGVYGQTSVLPDMLPTARDAAYDPSDDLWYQHLGGGFALLNERMFRGQHGGDLAAVYRDALDHTRFTAFPQLTSQRPLAQTNTIRAFDDTAQERTIVSWWQKQQHAVSVLLHGPVLRLLLPSSRLFVTQLQDQGMLPQRASGGALTQLRDEQIEVQIGATDDLLGVALRALEHSLLFRVREEQVPVVVPLGSPTEFRALAESWCLWWMRQKGVPHCEDAPAEVRQLRETLLTYADRIEDVRMLRGELARYAGTVLTLQTGVTAPLRDWVRAHMDAYHTLLREQERVRRDVLAQWEPIRQTMERYQSISNAPWCMNQRFTLPIYSLLDEWMPTRAQSGSVRNAVTDNGALPLPTLSVPHPEDLLVDLSALSFGTGTLTLPVLQPVQIRITNLPQPPTVDTIAHGLTDALPQLPSMDPVLAAVRQAAAQLPNPPDGADAPVLPAPRLPLPLGSQTDSIFAALDAIRAVVTGMEERTRLFWESIGPFTSQERDTQANADQSHVRRKQSLECTDWDDALCQHVETDLLERLTRIASRPDVHLREDVLSAGPPQVFSLCAPENRSCQPLHPEAEAPSLQWKLVSPDQAHTVTEQMREAVRNATLPSPVGTQDPALLPRYDIEPDELLPIYAVPPSIDLSPPSPVPVTP